MTTKPTLEQAKRPKKNPSQNNYIYFVTPTSTENQSLGPVIAASDQASDPDVSASLLGLGGGAVMHPIKTVQSEMVVLSNTAGRMSLFRMSIWKEHSTKHLGQEG